MTASIITAKERKKIQRAYRAALLRVFRGAVSALGEDAEHGY